MFIRLTLLVLLRMAKQAVPLKSIFTCQLIMSASLTIYNRCLGELL